MIEQLYEFCYDQLLGWSKNMTQNPAMAEDLVQEAFLRALMNADTLQDLHPEQRKSWLYRTVKNLYLDRMRHSRREVISGELPEQTIHPEEFEQVDDLLLLQELPDEESMLFTMRYLYGYSSNEIGKLYNMPPGTVRSKLSSARKHLREALKERKR